MVAPAPLTTRSRPLATPHGRLRAIISYEEYHPYGTTAWWTDPGSTVSQKRYRYTGKKKDEESGLYYHGARFYAPWLARWTTADRLGLKAGINRYTYCSNRPISRSDPTGYADKDDVARTAESLAAGLDELNGGEAGAYFALEDGLLNLDSPASEAMNPLLEEHAPEAAEEVPSGTFEKGVVNGLALTPLDMAFVGTIPALIGSRDWRDRFAEYGAARERLSPIPYDSPKQAEYAMGGELYGGFVGGLVLSGVAKGASWLGQGFTLSYGVAPTVELGDDLLRQAAPVVKQGYQILDSVPTAKPGNVLVFRATGHPEVPQVSKALRDVVNANPALAPAQGGIPDPFAGMPHVESGASGLDDYVSASTDLAYVRKAYRTPGRSIVVYEMPAETFSNLTVDVAGEQLFRDVIPEQWRIGILPQ